VLDAFNHQIDPSPDNWALPERIANLQSFEECALNSACFNASLGLRSSLAFVADRIVDQMADVYDRVADFETTNFRKDLVMRLANAFASNATTNNYMRKVLKNMFGIDRTQSGKVRYKPDTFYILYIHSS